MKKNFYEIIYDCIVTGKEEEEEVYGQKEQKELNDSYQQSLANKKERS